MNALQYRTVGGAHAQNVNSASRTCVHIIGLLVSVHLHCWKRYSFDRSSTHASGVSLYIEQEKLIAGKPEYLSYRLFRLCFITLEYSCFRKIPTIDDSMPLSMYVFFIARLLVREVRC